MTRIIDERYEVVRELGRGGQGTTYLARRLSDGIEVALKVLELSRADGWDSVAVFDREVGVLGGLTHPGIPRVIESFESDGAPVLVQEFVTGMDLEKRLEKGAQFNEARLRNIAEQVLDVLVYLHQYNPPVLHRDIKPANLVQRDDGSISVVDFGAAQGGQTGEAVIGSTGYMPVEQLRGRAVPVSDLYALGATLVRLATRKHPAELGAGLELEWRRFANVSDAFGDWIDQLLRPAAEDRFRSALDALRALRDLDRGTAIERHGETGLAMEYRTRMARYRIFHRGTRLTVFGPIEDDRDKFASIYVIVLGAFLIGALLSVPLAALFVCIWLIYRHDAALRLTGSPSGLDIVWRGGAEVVQRVALSDLAGFSIVNGVTLVVWTRDGKKLPLDTVLLRVPDIRELQRTLTAWLAEARRTQ